MSIWQAPLRTANYVYIASNCALVSAALLGLGAFLKLRDDQAQSALLATAALTFAGTIGELWSSGVKDRHSDLELASAVARAEEARVVSAEASLALERERGERLRLERAVSSRRLEPEIRAKLVAALQSRLPLRVEFTVLGDQEANIYGINLLEAFKEAGVACPLHSIGTMSPPPYGVQVNGNRALVEALMEAGVSFGLVPQQNAPNSILVGLKPPAI